MEKARVWLKLEGGVVLVSAVLAYSAQGWNKWWFLLFLLVPDISMLGYVFGQNVGRKVYNLGHSYILPAILGGLGLLNDVTLMQQASLIWIGHIGFDRLQGYGLKIDSFNQTHLGNIGRKK